MASVAKLLLVLAVAAVQVSWCDEDYRDWKPTEVPREYYTKADEDFGEDLECVSGTGRDCLTIVKIVIIASAICIGSVLLIGGVLAYIFVRSRHSVRGHRIYRCLASCCCCELPREEDSLVGVIVDAHDQTGASAPAAAGDNPSEMKNDSSDAPKILFSTNGEHTIVQPKPLLSDSQIKSEPTSDNDNEAVTRPPARGQAQVFPAIEGASSPPAGPHTYADAVKANTSSDSSNGVGGGNEGEGGNDVTDTSTPSGPKRKLKLGQLLRRAFSPSTSPTPVETEELETEGDKAVLVEHTDQPVSPVSPISQARDQSDNQFEIIHSQPLEDESFAAKQGPSKDHVDSSSHKKPRTSSATGGIAAADASASSESDVTADLLAEASAFAESAEKPAADKSTEKSSEKKKVNKSGSRISGMFRSFLSSGAGEDPDETS